MASPGELDQEAASLLRETFEAMAGLEPADCDRQWLAEMRGKVDLHKGIEWSRAMGCSESQITADCPNGLTHEAKVWELRVKRVSYYSETARLHSEGRWFDLPGAMACRGWRPDGRAAWQRYHECMLAGIPSEEYPYHETPITLAKLKRQLQDELNRMEEARRDRPIQLSNGKSVYAKQARSDCCMFG